jgi:hypothetical protein
VLYDWPVGYTPNAGPMDATLLVQLTSTRERAVPAQDYDNWLRERWKSMSRMRTDVPPPTSTTGPPWSLRINQAP